MKFPILKKVLLMVTPVALVLSPVALVLLGMVIQSLRMNPIGKVWAQTVPGDYAPGHWVMHSDRNVASTWLYHTQTGTVYEVDRFCDSDDGFPSSHCLLRVPLSSDQPPAGAATLTPY